MKEKWPISWLQPAVFIFFPWLKACGIGPTGESMWIARFFLPMFL
jgi:hypothetical protein